MTQNNVKYGQKVITDQCSVLQCPIVKCVNIVDKMPITLNPLYLKGIFGTSGYNNWTYCQYFIELKSTGLEPYFRRYYAG